MRFKISHILLVGEFVTESQFQKNSNILYYKNINELILYLKSNKIKFDKILIKGSRKINLEKVIDYL